MARKTPKAQVTFELLRAETVNLPDLSDDGKKEILRRIDDMEQKVIRLIQLRAQEKEVKEEIGYRDWDGTVHRGLSDEVEKLLIKYDLYDVGIKVEDFNVGIVTGSSPDWIDKIELLRLGVTEDIIQRATRPGTGWTSVRCQRIQKKERKKL